VFLSLFCQILGDCAGQKEDNNYGGSNPEGAIKIRISIEDVEEV
jgi:hypothetical protein